MEGHFTLRWGRRTTEVRIAPGLADRAGRLLRGRLPGRRILVVTDPTVGRLHAPRLERSLERAGFHVERLALPPGERGKTFAAAGRICRELAGKGFLRDSAVVALGGGVVGDLAGFAAAIYMRGIPVVQIPTTLLAQVDSCLGGKTGANLPEGKNLVGAFHQPAAVLADPDLLVTLPDRLFREGLSEALKYGVLRDRKLFGLLERETPGALRRDRRGLARLVERSLRNKAAVALADEQDRGVRQLLNFGHTFGHALEAAGRYRTWSHGEAVAVGMAAETRLSARLGILEDDRLTDRLEGALRRFGFRLSAPAPAVKAALPHLAVDKKRAADGAVWALPVRLGQCRVVTGIPAKKVEPLLMEIGRELNG